MGVVKVESILMEVFSNVEQVSGQDPLKFGFGNQKELDKVLVAKQRSGNNAYPLAWYVVPNKLSHEAGRASGNFQFLIAHNTKLDWFNDQRFEKVFEAVLFPYLENTIQAFKLSPNIETPYMDKYSWTNIPNYPYESGNESKQIDFWDVVSWEIELSVSNNEKC